ncbi:hypothetical protein [Kineosporia sp. NBRC 101731]|uniref:hypothetical protein n=1 Tax=Kineosporia sp. NBRC 101731 TaxID=3032199 RepID=UPI0025529D72|nr:hypothetical protein [Kineosporia sp. NBRC 101731]
MDRPYVDAVYADSPGLRLPLPVTLPDGYRFLGFHGATSRDSAGGTEIIARDASFAGPSDTVTICAEILGTGNQSCPETNVHVMSEQQGVRRTVFIEPAEVDARNFWADVQYSDTPDDWTWLP